MGLGSILKGIGKVAAPVAGIVGAPMTGGASLGLLGLGGGILSGMGGGAATERTAQNNQIATGNQLAADNYRTQQSAASQLAALEEAGLINRAKLGVEAPSARSKQLVAGSLLQNLKPFSVTPTSSKVKIPQISGGLTPAALSGLVRQGGGELQKQALAAMLSGSDVPKGLDYGSKMLTAPTPTKMKDPGFLETMGSTLGPILSGLGQMTGGTGAQGRPPMNNQMPMPQSGFNQAMVPSNAQMPGFPGWAPPDLLTAQQNTALPQFQSPVARRG